MHVTKSPTGHYVAQVRGDGWACICADMNRLTAMRMASKLAYKMAEISTNLIGN